MKEVRRELSAKISEGPAGLGIVSSCPWRQPGVVYPFARHRDDAPTLAWPLTPTDVTTAPTHVTRPERARPK
jgi:hypothetical protein